MFNDPENLSVAESHLSCDFLPRCSCMFASLTLEEIRSASSRGSVSIKCEMLLKLRSRVVEFSFPSKASAEYIHTLNEACDEPKRVFDSFVRNLSTDLQPESVLRCRVRSRFGIHQELPILLTCKIDGYALVGNNALIFNVLFILIHHRPPLGSLRISSRLSQIC